MIKIGRFFEEHVEKMILVIVGIVCVYLLIFRVLLSPNVIEYEQKKFSPGDIDNYIYGQAELLGQRLNDPPEDPNASVARVDDYVGLVNSVLGDIDVSLWPLRPYEVPMEAVAGRAYRPPRSIGPVDEVAVEHIRSVAYVPTEPITQENPYDKSGNEPNDLDLVTVEAKFDVRALYDKFHEVFVEYVEEQWADPCLARPVFAAVQLQRQELLADGAWSEWQSVPRTRIDQYSKLFEIVEDVRDLPAGGLKVQMLQFDDKQVQIELLQPQAYQVASAREEWFPPLLHRKYVDFQRKETLEEKREAREAEKEEREKELEERRSRRAETRPVVGGRTGGGMYDGLGGEGMYGTGARDARSRGNRGRDRLDRTGVGRITDVGRPGDRRRAGDRGMGMDTLYMREGDLARLGAEEDARTRRGPSMDDVYNEYDALLLTRQTDFSKLREPMTFWAHDDTVEPQKTYRYRIRLGVFNPVAQAGQSGEQDGSPMSNVILWSDFSSVTDVVEIMGKSFFFAKNMRETDKTVTVQVSKLVLGQWYSHDFPVNRGEVIGDVVESEPEEPERRSIGPRGRPATVGRTDEEVAMLETIDYGTGAVMVDAVAVDDWSGDRSMRSRHYYDMLYSFDGVNIEHMPVSTTCWDPDLQRVFGDIARLARLKPEPFKPFGEGGRRRRIGDRDFRDGGLYDEMMYDEMMMGERGLYP